jgi:hypothetical protein
MVVLEVSRRVGAALPSLSLVKSSGSRELDARARMPSPLPWPKWPCRWWRGMSASGCRSSSSTADRRGAYKGEIRLVEPEG